MADFHTQKAYEYFFGDTSSEARALAKNLNFGLLYGMGADRRNAIMNENEEYRRKAHVVLECTKEFYDADIVGKAPYFQNISENFQGQDELSFECPECGQDHTSLIYG